MELWKNGITLFIILHIHYCIHIRKYNPPKETPTNIKYSQFMADYLLKDSYTIF